MTTLPRLTAERSDFDEFYYEFHKRQGSDSGVEARDWPPPTQCRGVWLQQQVDKETKLRAGAEKLLMASSNAKLRDGICRELGKVNCNLQVMKEELAALSSTSSTPFNGGSSFSMLIPLLTIPLKETCHVDFHSSLKFILSSHYYVETDAYRTELKTLSDMRDACCLPTRDEAGIDILFDYYNQLFFADRRFFPAEGSGPVSFTWYDCFTGLAHTQNTIGFEKGSILFNIAALYSQRAAKQMSADNDAGLQVAGADLRRAAGTLRYLLDNFSHAPSADLQTHSVHALAQLLLAQAHECEVRRVVARGGEVRESSQMVRALRLDSAQEVQRCVELAQDAAMVTLMYDESLSLLDAAPIAPHIPAPWRALVRCKRQYFGALARWFVAQALTVRCSAEDKPARHFVGLHASVDVKCRTVYSDQLIHDVDGRTTLARAHLRQSIRACEEALSVAAQSAALHELIHGLKKLHDKSLHKFSLLEEEDDFSELLLPPDICPRSKRAAEAIQPDFAKYKVEDIFRSLGCLAIFSARHSWTRPRLVSMIKRGPRDEFGFSVRGDCPVIVATIEPNSLAQIAGLFVGDFVVAIGDEDVRWTKHDIVVSRIRSSGDTVRLRVVTPTDHNYIDPSSPPPCSQPPLAPLTPAPSPVCAPLRGSHAQKGAESFTTPSTGSSAFIVKERPLSSFSWKLRKRRSNTKDMLGGASPRLNASNHSYG